MRYRFSFLLLLLLAYSQASTALIEITDSHGKYRFASPPQRVVVLNWALAEHMLELGVEPVGMADIAGFTSHSMGKPAIPASVKDVGSRLNPNLQGIRELKPDIILIGYSQRPLLRPLSNIATVIYFKNFGKRYHNAEKSILRFKEMAKLFDKTAKAEALLQSRTQKFTALRDQLDSAFAEQKKPLIQLLVPSKKGDVLLFSENSLPVYAAREIGLQVLVTEQADQFGTARISQSEADEQLEKAQASAQPVCRLLFTSYADDKAVPLEELQDGTCTKVLSYQNAFGGVMSLQYLSEAIFSALVD